jgi:hypothetical protein
MFKRCSRDNRLLVSLKEDDKATVGLANARDRNSILQDTCFSAMTSGGFIAEPATSKLTNEQTFKVPQYCQLSRKLRLSPSKGAVESLSMQFSFHLRETLIRGFGCQNYLKELYGPESEPASGKPEHS